MDIHIPWKLYSENYQKKQTKQEEEKARQDKTRQHPYNKDLKNTVSSRDFNKENQFLNLPLQRALSIYFYVH